MVRNLEGTEVLGFRLVELLGAGGMASVWRAEHMTIARTVAVKVLKPELADDPTILERFRREAEVQSRLRHPNIVAGENFSLDPLAMVMEYVEGRTLEEIIGREVGPIPLARALPYMQAILDAVEHAHEQGVIHRDIKPSNVVVTGDDQVKVMDFGIAKVLRDSRLTGTGASLGTAVYMSPEQIRGSSEADERSDIYSLGVTFYEMLAGRAPFEAESWTRGDFDVRMAHVQQDPPDPRQFYADIPGAVVDVLTRCLAKDPAQRFQDVGQLRAALEGACLGQGAAAAQAIPVPSRPPPAPTVVEQQPVHRPAPTRVEAPPMTEPMAPANAARAPARSRLPLTLGLLGGLALLVAVALVVSLGGSTKKDQPARQGVDLEDTGEQQREVTGAAGGEGEPTTKEGRKLPHAAGPPESGAPTPSKTNPAPAPAPAPAPVSIRPLRGSASSHKTLARVASRAVDQNVDSWWQEGARGDGIGQWLRVDWDGVYEVHEVRIIPGYMKYRDDKYGHRWGMNNRLKRIRLVFSSGHTFEHDLRDTRGWHTIKVAAPTRARWLRIEIRGVYPGWYKGHRIKDSGICELEVWGVLRP